MIRLLKLNGCKFGFNNADDIHQLSYARKILTNYLL